MREKKGKQSKGEIVKKKENSTNPVMMSMKTKRGVCKKEGAMFGKIFTVTEKLVQTPFGTLEYENVKGSFRWIANGFIQNMADVKIKHGFAKSNGREYICLTDDLNDELVLGSFIYIDEIINDNEFEELFIENDKKEKRKADEDELDLITDKSVKKHIQHETKKSKKNPINGTFRS